MADLDLSGFDKAVAAAPKEDKQLDLSHFDKAVAQSAPQEQPGMLEAGVRGGLNGLTLGSEAALAGALQTAGDALDGKTNGLDDLISKYKQYRDLEQAKNKAASDAHPVASLAGNIVGGLPLAALTGGASEEATLANAVKSGAMLGAGSGLGNSLSEGKGVGDTLKNTIEGAGMGMGTGALLHGAIGTGKFVGNKIADTDTYNNFVNSVKHSMDGVQLTGKSAGEGIRNMVSDAAEALGLGEKDALNTANTKLGAVRGSKQAEPTNVSQVVDGLKAAITKLNKSEDPDAATDAEYLQKYLDNLVLGKDTADVDVSHIIPEKTIPGTPSGQDKIEAAKALLEAKENALPKGVTTEVVPSTDDSGNPFLNILKQIPGEDESSPAQSIAKTLPATPGTPDQVIPASFSTPQTQQIRIGGIDPNATPFSKASDIKSTLTRYGGNAGNNSPLKTNDAINAMSALAKGLNNDLIQAPVGGIGPATELGQATKNSQLGYRALKALGLDESDFPTNAITGEKELTSQAEASLKNKIRQGVNLDSPAGQNSSDKLSESLEYLRQINPEMADQLEAQTQRAGEINSLYRLGQGANFTKSSILRTAPVQAGAFIGSGLKNLGVPEGLSFAKNVVSNVTQGISSTQIAQTAKSLLSTGSPNQMKLAQMLGDALNNKTDTARNAAVFSLMQQPGYRELLKQHGLSGDENQ